MKFLSQMLTAASGSVGGCTFSHNRSGMYVRARATPVNPATGNQLAVRDAMTNLVTRWTNILTPAQRSAWTLWADNTPFTNALGAPLILTGQQAYIGANVARVQSNTKLGTTLAINDDAPVIFDRGDFTTPVPTYGEFTGLSLEFTPANAWANQIGSAMFIFQGRPQNASVNFFKGPFRLIGAIEGDSPMAPSSPFTVSTANLALLGFPTSALQNIWTKVVVSFADGRYTSPRIIGPTSVNP